MKDCRPENCQIGAKPCRILILGGGFGGIYAALELQKLLRRRNDIAVTLLSRDNFFLFTPMLHEVATSDLEINTIIGPLHKLLPRIATFVGNIEAIDLTAKSVRASHGFDSHSHDLPLSTWSWHWVPVPISSGCPELKAAHLRFGPSLTPSPCAAA